jgi:hypothetical protein
MIQCILWRDFSKLTDDGHISYDDTEHRQRDSATCKLMLKKPQVKMIGRL